MLHPRTIQNNRFLYRWVNRRKGDGGDGGEQVQSSLLGAPERGERERVSAAGPTITFGRSRCSRSMAASAMRTAIGTSARNRWQLRARESVTAAKSRPLGRPTIGKRAEMLVPQFVLRPQISA